MKRFLISILVTMLAVVITGSISPAAASRPPAGIQVHRTINVVERKVVHRTHDKSLPAYRKWSHRKRRHRLARRSPVRHRHPEVLIHHGPLQKDEAISIPQVPPQSASVNPEDDFSILSDWAYSETEPAVKPADLIKEEFASLAEGSPRQEIRLVSAALGLDVGLMDAFAKIESDFDPHERTGSYIGLYQLSRHEFERYGPSGGNILDARDNAIAAALKIEYEEALFKISTRHIPSNADLYLIHQQGLQGAAQHLAEPQRPAWKSMCATDEGKQKGEGWCKKAIWGNTLPAIKHIWKSVEDLTSGTFVQMWSNRVASLLGRPAPSPEVMAQAKEYVSDKQNSTHVEHEHNQHAVVRVAHRVHRHLVHRHLRHYAHA